MPFIVGITLRMLATVVIRRFYFSTGIMKRDLLDFFPDLIVVFLVIASIRTISLVSYIATLLKSISTFIILLYSTFTIYHYHYHTIIGYICHRITVGLVLHSSQYLNGSTFRVPFKNFSEDCTYECAIVTRRLISIFSYFFFVHYVVFVFVSIMRILLSISRISAILAHASFY